MKEETNHPVLLTAWTFSLEYCRAGGEGEKGERKRGGGKGREREGERGKRKKKKEREKHTITSSTYNTKRQLRSGKMILMNTPGDCNICMMK